MRFLVPIVLAVALIAVAFNFAKPLPDKFTEDSFLPKASSVKYIAAGNDASLAGLLWIKGLTSLGESFLSGKEYNHLSHVANLCTELDSLFYTPYYFVGSITPTDTRDTSDFVVMRRAPKNFPDEWRLAVGYALRLSNGPFPNKREAADVMRPYFDSPDTTIPEHIRLMYRSFELDAEQTETALEMVLNDVIQPRFKKFRNSFYNKTFRVLGYRGVGVTTGADSTQYNEVKKTIDLFAEGKIPAPYAFHHLLALKKVETPKAKEPTADTVASVADTTAAAADSSAAVADTTANN